MPILPLVPHTVSCFDPFPPDAVLRSSLNIPSPHAAVLLLFGVDAHLHQVYREMNT